MSMVDSLPTGPYIPQEDDNSDDCVRSKKILKSKENILKSKHNKSLKKKLKKYKIKKDGKEDPDVLDVSQTFNQSLNLKSPIQSPTLKKEFEDDIFKLERFERPRNYLFKMVRRKQSVLTESNGVEGDMKCKSKPVKKITEEENAVEENIIPASANIQKKQTNAFQLLMDSRNKSIGSNSPGKNIVLEESESEEIIEKKKTKVIRNLALQKLADAKGALMKKEMEKQQDEIIKRKMIKRAERLKKMITNGKVKKDNKSQKKQVIAAIPVVSIDDDSSSDSRNEKAGVKTLKDKMKSKKLDLKNGKLSDINDATFVDSPKKTRETLNQNNLAQKLGLKNGKLSKLRDDTFSKLNNQAEMAKPNEGNGAKKLGLKNRKLKDIDIFVSSERKKVSKEDAEFLKKLSPSIKKKENMMSYFKKVEKETELVLLSDDETTSLGEDKETQAIKVKLTPRNKKKNKKRKLSLLKIDNRDKIDCNENNTKEEVHSENNIQEADELHLCSNKITRKRKRQNKAKTTNQSDPPEDTVSTTINDSLNTVEGRPKRNVKKPVKYVDDVQLTSSDEELHIFTPKKKKHADGKSKSEDINDKDFLKTPKREAKQKIIPSNKSTKLAPIFVAKTTVDTAALEAKQKFLHSGIPDQLKKIIAQQKTQAVIAYTFYPVVHVQQIDLMGSSTINSNLILYDEYDLDSDLYEPVHDNVTGIIKKCLSIEQAKEESNYIIPTKQIDIKGTLQIIKNNYPEFPVYRTYRTLNSKSTGEQRDFNCINFDNSSEGLSEVADVKNEDPDCLSWADKYKATSTKHMIGNFESINELRNWLQSWTENYVSPKNDNADSDSDFYNSDADSRDAKIANNLVIVTGPAGSGKTSSVYAVATELAIKVIEVNVSSKRTGKILLQDLQEATQSHKVNRGKGGSGENSQNSQELTSGKAQKQKKALKQYASKKVKVSGLSQKSESFSQSSQEDGRTGMSLILIDDADIVFDQDDGFISAIGQLVQCSKRPVILVTTTLSCQHLQRFLYCGNVIKMKPLSPRILGTWLDIMCLADTGICWPGTGAKFLEYFNGDMRKTINCLQFYVSSELLKQLETNPSYNTSQQKSNCIDIEDENSSMSWVGQNSEDCKEKNQKFTDLSEDCVWKHFLGNPEHQLHLKYPVDLFNVWWSIPQLLTVEVKTENDRNSVREKVKTLSELEEICNIFDSISLADCMGFHNRPDTKSDIFSYPWHCAESDSVSERENMENVNSNIELSNSISYELVKSCLENAHRTFKTPNNHIYFPALLEQRKKDKLMSRHEILTNSVSLNSVFDRKALTLDYWSACRSICRIEKGKTDNNTKRNNRFCHYLKSNKTMSKNDVFEKLCDSLKPSETSKDAKS